MEIKDCLEAGRISKTFGYKGEMIAGIRKGFFETLQKEGSVFIETDGELVPYFFEEIEEEDDDYIRFNLDGIGDVDLAKPFCGKSLWLPQEVIPASVLEAAMDLDIEGYQVSDVQHGELGTVAGLDEYPQHLILRIRMGHKEILVPYIPEFIKKIDHRKKTILLKTPEGLIEAYL